MKIKTLHGEKDKPKDGMFGTWQTAPNANQVFEASKIILEAWKSGKSWDQIKG